MLAALSHDYAIDWALAIERVSGALGSGGGSSFFFFSSTFLAPFFGGRGYRTITSSTDATAAPFLNVICETARISLMGCSTKGLVGLRSPALLEESFILESCLLSVFWVATTCKVLGSSY